MVFSPSVIVLIVTATALQTIAVVKIKSFPALRKLLAFYIVRDVLLFVSSYSALAYWDVYWFTAQVAWVWWTWIAVALFFPVSPVPRWAPIRVQSSPLPRWARIPIFCSIALAVFCWPLTSTPQAMQIGQAAVFVICLATVLTGLAAGLVRRIHAKRAFALALLFAVTASASILAWRGANPAVGLAAWMAALGFLLAVELPQPA